MKLSKPTYNFNALGTALLIAFGIKIILPALAKMLGLTSRFSIMLPTYFVIQLLMWILPYIFIENMCEYHPTLFSGKPLDKHAPAILSTDMLMVIVITLLNRLLITNPLSKIGVIFPPQSLHPTDNAIQTIFYFIYMAVCPAILEEIFFRGYFINIMLPYGRRFAIITSSVAFALMHDQIQSFIPLFFAGIILACIYLYTDNIYMSMALHFINNAYSFIMLYSQQNENAISAVSFSVFVISLIFVCGTFGAFQLLKSGVKISDVLLQDSVHSRKITDMFTSPIFILFLLFTVFNLMSKAYPVIVQAIK